MAQAPKTQRTTCASCGVAGPIHLGDDGICAACLSADAWSGYTQEPLVIARSEAEAAVPVGAERPLRGAWIFHGVLGAVSLMALLFASLACYGALSAIPIGGLGTIMEAIDSAASRALWTGIASLVVGAVGAIALRRSLKIRSLGLIALHVLVVVTGIVSTAIGALYGLGGSGHIAYRTVPSVEYLRGRGIAPSISRIADSTVVVLAPDENNDARYMSLGTGAIIASQKDQAWVVTCSHVAMPYVSPGSYRDPAQALPVWIEFSDGRGAVGDVVWSAPPPLDVVVVAVTIDSPPPAVEISPSTDLLDEGSPVVFVPNPLLHGWQVFHGAVEERRSHNTPAGEYALVVTSLPVQAGDSGSGLFDDQGRLVGLNTWASYRQDGSHGISLPSEVLRSLEGAILAGKLSSLDRLIPASATKETPAKESDKL